jgi:hypothetical protein
MRLVQLGLVLVFWMLVVAPSAYAQKRVALVIGNSVYQHTPKLKNPANDATDTSTRTISNSSASTASAFASIGTR